MSRVKIAAACGAFLFFGWTCYSFYNYFCDLSYPEVQLQGIEDTGYCAGDVQCILSGSDGYKVSNVSIWIDQKPVVSHHLINKSEFEYAFPVATKALADGKHSMKIAVQDSSFKKNTTTKDIQFTVDNIPLRAAFVTSDVAHKVFQGHTLHIQLQANKPQRSLY